MKLNVARTTALVLVAIATLLGGGMRNVLALDQSKLVDVIAKTGMGHSFNTIGDAVLMGMEKVPPGAADRDKLIASAKAAAKEAFEPAAMKQKLQAELAAALTDADLDATLTFYNTPVAQRMTQLENAAQTVEVAKEVEKTASDIMKRLSEDKPRAALINGIDTSLTITDSTIDNAMVLQRATLIGMVSARGPVDLELVDKIVAQARPKVAEHIARVIPPTLAHTYREASNEELQTYLAFLRSPEGQKLYATGRAAKNRVLINASLAFGELLGKAMNAKPL